MRLALLLEPDRNAKWHLARQMGLSEAVSGFTSTDEFPIWNKDAAFALKQRYAAFGLNMEIIEGWLPTDNIIQDTESAEHELDLICRAIENMGAAGIGILSYSWMTKIGWHRTSTTVPLRGGALGSGYERSVSEAMTWPAAHTEISEDLLWRTLEKFLKRVVPVAEKAGVLLALHPDDPPISPVQGIGRIMTSPDAFERAMALAPSPNNGINFCQGSFAAMGCDIPATIRRLGKNSQIKFVHFRDVSGTAESFFETFHDDGPTDMFEAMRAYIDVGFDGIMRPDHTPSMYGEPNDPPGYEALGRLFAIGYMRGLFEGASKTRHLHKAGDGAQSG